MGAAGTRWLWLRNTEGKAGTCITTAAVAFVGGLVYSLLAGGGWLLGGATACTMPTGGGGHDPGQGGQGGYQAAVGSN